MKIKSKKLTQQKKRTNSSALHEKRNGRKERAMGNESHESGIARVNIISSTDAKKGSGNARGRKKRTSLGVRKSSDENAGIPNDSTRATSARKTVDDDNKWVEYYRRKYLED